MTVAKVGGVISSPSTTLLRESLPYVGCCVLIFHSFYLLLQETYDGGWTSYIGLPTPSAQVCQEEVENEKCGRPDLFAFQIVSGFIFWICGGLGLYSWLYSVPSGTPESRFYGYDTPAKWLTIINFSYQLWDFVVSFGIPEHCTIIMMLHHVVAATVSWSALYNDMVGYYATFFLGLSEVSSIFLVALDFSKYFQPQPGSWFQFYVGSIAGPCFAVTFVLFRVVLWWPVSFQLFQDVKKVNKDLRPGRSWILYMWCCFNIPMGLLQLYWLTIIVVKAQETLAA